MIQVDWIPERYPPSGTIGAAGFYKLLGRPQLDPLTVLVRETAQNSWDAKKPRSRSVRFLVHGRDLEPDERAFLVDVLLTQRDRARGTGLERLPDGCTALFITDRGTRGLGGPVSASDVSDDDVYDWVDFVLNVGKANTQGHTGGTYGFGKTIAYVVSAVNTVVVYSRARHKGRLQTRLMACAIGGEFKGNNVLHTGRHWWGRDINGAPNPLVDSEAEIVAAALGMPKFEGNETGTTLMIVQPDFGDRTPEQGMRFIAEAALWNLWPKLVPRAEEPAEMSVSVRWNSKRIPVPTPESRPPLAGFVQAFQEMAIERTDDNRPPGFQARRILLERPKVVAGLLATVPIAVRGRAVVDDGHFPEDSQSPRSAAMIEGPAHHVALLRSPNLVVEYLEGPAAPEASFEWAGVFRSEDALDAVFAMAEPPTHDSWRPDLIPDRTNKSVVKMTLQNIRKVLDDRWGTRSVSQESPVSSTSVLAHRLAHLVAGVAGTAAEPSVRARGSGATKRQARVEFVGSGPAGDGSAALTEIVLMVTPSPGDEQTDLAVSVGIALAGGGVDVAADPGLALRSVEIHGVTSELSGREGRFRIVGGEPTTIRIIASRTADLSLAFDVQVLEVATS